MKHFEAIFVGSFLFILFTSVSAQLAGVAAVPATSTTTTPLVAGLPVTSTTTTPLVAGLPVTSTTTTPLVAGLLVTTSTTTTPLVAGLPVTTSTTGTLLSKTTSKTTTSTTGTLPTVTSGSTRAATTVYPTVNGVAVPSLFTQTFSSYTTAASVPTGSIGLGTITGSVGITRAVQLFTVSASGATSGASSGRESIMLKNNGVFIGLAISLFFAVSGLIIY